jgi:hypothetical protein
VKTVAAAGLAATLSLGLTVLTLAGCTKHVDPLPQPTAVATASPASSVPDSEALVSLSPNAAYEIPVSSGETIADGSLVFSNSGAHALRITALKPTLSTKATKGIRTAGVKLVGLKNGSDEAIGIRRSFPPSDSVADVWTDAVGSVLAPSTEMPAYEMIIGLRVTEGVHTFSSLRVTFEVDNNSYVKEFPFRTTLCKAKNATATSC